MECNKKIKDWKQESVREILEKYSGEKIIEYFEEKNNLIPMHRKSLAHILVRYFLSQKIKLGRDSLQKISELIVESFPCENSSYYYAHPVEKGKCPTGLLYWRYTNQVGKINKEVKKIKTPIPVACKRKADSENFDVNDDIDFLKKNHKPFSVVQEKWKSTFIYRTDLIKSAEKLNDVLVKFPILSNLEINHLLVRFNNNYLLYSN